MTPTETLRRALDALQAVDLAEYLAARDWLEAAEKAMNPATPEEEANAILRAGREQARRGK